MEESQKTDEKETHRRITQNAAWLFGGQITGRLLRTLVVIYAARVLGVAGWGAFSYALSIATLLTVFSDVGINALLTRESAKNPEVRSFYLSTSFYIKLVLMAALGTATIFLARFMTSIEEAVALMPIVVIIVIFDALRDMGAAVSRAMEKMRIEGINNIITNAALTAAGFWVLFNAPSSESLLWAYALGTGVGLVAIAVSLRKHITGLFTHFRKDLVGQILNSAWPFGLLGIMGIVMINSDIIILGWLRGAHDVGLYSSGQKIVQLLYMAPVLITAAFFPALSKSTDSPAKFKSLLEQGLGIIFMIALPLAAGGMILGEEMISFFYGAEYLPAVLSFSILMSTLVMVFPAILIGNAIFAHDKHRGFAIYAIAVTVSNIIFDIALIPIWGIEGAAVATLFNQILINIYAWKKIRTLAHFTIFRRLRKIALAGAVMSVGVILLNLAGAGLFTAVAIGGLLYAGVLWITKDEFLYRLAGRNIL